MPVTEEEAMSAYARLKQFAASAPFQSFLLELTTYPPEARHEFVASVILNGDRLGERGLPPPDDIAFQRTVFEDGRDTLFCIVTYLSDGITKATLTFDNAG